MKNKINEILKKRNIIDFLIIFIIVSIISIPLLNNRLDIYCDDGIQHISRAYGTLKSIKDGNFKIITSFTNNFGYSWNLFYGPLTTYGIILLELVFRNFVIAYKIFVYLLLFLSGITMYKLVYSMTNNRNVALLSSAIYVLAPYHITDLYIRNALGEFASFVFIPLVFLGLYNLFNTTDNNYYLSIGAIGLILTHNLSTIITAIFAFIYLIINIRELRKTKVIRDLLINVFFILLITSFFWMPLLEARFSASYSAYEEGFMSSSETTASRGLSLSNLFVTLNTDVFVFEVGPCLILLAFSIMSLRNLETNRKEYILFLVFAILSLFMSTKYFPWKYLPNSFSIIQFPWRMLEFSTFFLSIVCSINAYIVIKKFNLKDVFIIIIILLVYIIAFTPYIKYLDEKIINIEDINQGVVSGKENEIVAGIAKGEYLTKNANKDKFYLATREDKVYVLSGKSIIEKEEKTNKGLLFKVNNLEKTEYEAPYIYYPGYQVTVDGIEIDNYETENGFLGFSIDEKTEATVEIVYKGTKLMNISYFISIISLVLFCVYVWKKH
ncbi:MAG: 6-pyruvoyl-tetrahydropterin synthase-related protein [Candidatus Scatovivens sp.]